MSDRFNFFDFFGYLLPGALLLALIWLPFGIMLDEWPSADWSAAGIVVALAYIAGHFIRQFSENTFSSKYSYHGKSEHPSYLLLEEKKAGVDIYSILGSSLPNEMIAQIAGQIHRMFRLNVNDTASRTAAFFQCRSFLIQKGAAAYTEQMDGMYNLMRGISASFLFASALYFGMAISLVYEHASFLQSAFPVKIPVHILLLAFVLLGLSSFIASKIPTSAWRKRLLGAAFWICVFSTFCSGFLGLLLISSHAGQERDSSTVAMHNYSNIEHGLDSETNAVAYHDEWEALSHLEQADIIQLHVAFLLLASGCLTLCLAAVSYSAFRYFAVQFAATVYRDFNALAPLAAPSHGEVAAYAYYMFERDGKQNGKDVDQWLQAESELKSARGGDTPQK
jgi:Protein of unknown function (DUF2934)